MAIKVGKKTFEKSLERAKKVSKKYTGNIKRTKEQIKRAREQQKKFSKYLKENGLKGNRKKTGNTNLTREERLQEYAKVISSNYRATAQKGKSNKEPTTQRSTETDRGIVTRKTVTKKTQKTKAKVKTQKQKRDESLAIRLGLKFGLLRKVDKSKKINKNKKITKTKPKKVTKTKQKENPIMTFLCFIGAYRRKDPTKQTGQTTTNQTNFKEIEFEEEDFLFSGTKQVSELSSKPKKVQKSKKVEKGIKLENLASRMRQHCKNGSDPTSKDLKAFFSLKPSEQSKVIKMVNKDPNAKKGLAKLKAHLFQFAKYLSPIQKVDPNKISRPRFA